jgi:hypothetical protein
MAITSSTSSTAAHGAGGHGPAAGGGCSGDDATMNIPALVASLATQHWSAAALATLSVSPLWQSHCLGVAEAVPARPPPPLAPPRPSPRPLIVDALNKLSYFMPTADDDGDEFHGASAWERVAAMQTRVGRFIDACKAGAYTRPLFSST